MNESSWIKYTGEYEKTFYDIELMCGEIIYNCYPNANTFHTNGQVIEGKDVRNIRISKENNMSCFKIKKDGTAEALEKIPEGAVQAHMYKPEGMLKPRGSMIKESIGLKICEELISYYESWTDPKYGDNPGQAKVIEILKKNLDDEVAAAWKTFLYCINTGENVWDVVYKDRE